MAFDFASSVLNANFDVQIENSLDLDSGQCPKLKSDEFSIWTPKVIEI